MQFRRLFILPVKKEVSRHMRTLNREFWSYITFAALGMLGSSGTIFADTFFVSGRLGADGLAALNIAIPVFGLINGTGLLLGVGGATRYTVYRSQHRTQEANRAFTLALTAALGAGACFLAAGLFFSGGIARMLGSLPVRGVFGASRHLALVCVRGTRDLLRRCTVRAAVRKRGEPSGSPPV